MFISLVCIKLVALRINRYTKSSTHFQKGWEPLLWSERMWQWCEQWCDWHRSTTVVRLRTSPWRDKCKNWAPILLVFRYSILFCFSVSCCFLAFFGSFWTVVFLWFRVLVGLYRNRHSDTVSFLNFFRNVGEGPPPVASGLLSIG